MDGPANEWNTLTGVFPCVRLALVNPGSTANQNNAEHINEELLINNKLQYLLNVRIANIQCVLSTSKSDPGRCLKTASPAKKWPSESHIHVTGLPTQTWQPDTCSLTDEEMKYSFPPYSYIVSSVHFYSSLLTRSQPQSSWPVICDLPVWGCNKVSMQLKIHFPVPTQQITGWGPWIDAHALTRARAHNHCLCHTHQTLHKRQHGITNHCWGRKGNY